MNEPLLKVLSLSVGYTTPLFPPIDTELYSGEVTALLGENGIGKSTLLKTLSGELKPLSGKVKIYGEDIDRISRKNLSRKLAIVTTDTTGAGGLTVYQTVALGRHPHTGFMGKLTATDRDIIQRSMDETGISFKADAYFAHISDGEKQKTLIARALAQETPIILLDEPFSFLDTASRIEILSLLRKIARDKDRAILFSSHDVSQALRMSSSIWLMTHSRRFVRGTPDELIQTSLISEMFNRKGIMFDPEQNDFIGQFK